MLQGLPLLFSLPLFDRDEVSCIVVQLGRREEEGGLQHGRKECGRGVFRIRKKYKDGSFVYCREIE